jgi:hypothetical protein
MSFGAHSTLRERLEIAVVGSDDLAAFHNVTFTGGAGG